MQQRLLTPRILWGGLLFSTLIYLFILQVVVRPMSEPQPTLLYALAVAALGSAVASVAVPMKFYREAVKTLRVNANIPGSGPVLSSPESIFAAALPKFQTPFILGMALSESVALYGFTLGFLNFPLESYAGFFVVSWVLMLSKFPTLGKVLGPIEEAHGIRIPY